VVDYERIFDLQVLAFKNFNKKNWKNFFIKKREKLMKKRPFKDLFIISSSEFK